MLIQKNKVTIVCEMSQTYEGKFDVASKLVGAAIDAKADAIKFQVFKADELGTKDYKHYDLFTSLEFTPEQWGDLIKQAQDGGILAFADVFGLESAQMLIEKNIDGFKIHPTDIKNPPLLEFLAKSGKPLMLSVGGSHGEEIEKAISILNENGAKEVVLMHGFQSYPTLVEHTNLNKMSLFKDDFGLPVGFADHVDGDHSMRYDLCAMALAMGASVLEKHITLDRKLKMEDYESALDPNDFKDFVERMRSLETAFGKKNFELTDPEKEYRKGTKKHIIASKDLEKGTVVSEGDIFMKRTAEEYEFLDREDVVGKTLSEEIKKDRVIKLENLK